MSKISTSDFQKGMFIKFREEPYQIVEFKHVNPGKGSAFVRTKLKAIKCLSLPINQEKQLKKFPSL